MTQEERVDSLVHKLRRCFRFLHRNADGKRWSQNRVLRELRYHGDMTQKSMQEHIGIQQSSLSELLSKMEEQHLLQRTPCPTDRRHVTLSLTQEGRQLLEESEKADLRQNIVYLQVLTPQEQQTLLELLTKLDDSWTSQYPRTQCRPAIEEGNDP